MTGKGVSHHEPLCSEYAVHVCLKFLSLNWLQIRRDWGNLQITGHSTCSEQCLWFTMFKMHPSNPTGECKGIVSVNLEKTTCDNEIF